MPRPHITRSSTRRYGDSPLAQMITAALAKITELQQKYPLSTQGKKGRRDQDAFELLYSYEKMDVVKDFLNRLNALLKQFDNDQTPTVGLSMLKEVNEIQLLQMKLLTRQGALYQAIIEKLPQWIQKATAEVNKAFKKEPDINQTSLLQEKLRGYFNGAKQELKTKIEAIPGKAFEALFDEMIALVLNQESYSDLPCVFNQMSRELFKSEAQYALMITHPMTYEFVLFMAELMWQRPRELSQLVSFLNPKALNVDLNSGVVGILVRKLLENSYMLKLDESVDPTLYQYQLTTFYNSKKTSTETIQGSDYYVNYFDDFFKLLTSGLPPYIRDYSDQSIIQSELARTKLLQRLIDQEVEWINCLVNEQHALNSSDEQVNAIKALQVQFKQRLDAYETQTIRDLVQPYTEVREQLSADLSKQYDVTYADEPLPDNVLLIKVEPPAQVRTLSIKSKLLNTLASAQAILIDRLQSIETTGISRSEEAHDGGIEAVIQQTILSTEALKRQSQQWDESALQAKTEQALMQLRSEAANIILEIDGSVLTQEATLEHRMLIEGLSDYYDSIMAKHDMTCPIATQLQAYTEIHNLLQPEQPKKAKVPFKAIDAHPFLHLSLHPPMTGFNLLLALLGMQKDTAAWARDRKHQEAHWTNPFKKNKTETADLLRRRSELTEAIDLKIKFLQNIQRLSAIIAQFKEKHQQLTQCMAHHRVNMFITAASQSTSELLRSIQQEPHEGTQDQMAQMITLIHQIKEQYDVIFTLASEMEGKLQGFEQIQQVINTALENQKALIQAIVHLGLNLLQNYNQALEQQYQEVVFDEKQTTYSSNDVTLTKLNDLLAQQEQAKALAALVGFTYGSDFFEQMEEQITIKARANQSLAQRIQNRRSVVATFKTKGQEIEILKNQLDGYEASGDSHELVTFINAHIQQFKGQGFQVTLHQLWCALIDLDSQIPIDYLSVGEEDLSHLKACQLLEQAPAHYKKSIEVLYQQISAMTNYGKKLAQKHPDDGRRVERLSEMLVHDVDCFVIKNQRADSQAQKQENFHQFKEKFIHRVHTEDDVMHHHAQVWKPLVTNLILGLLTVGIALGIKFIYSVVKEGRKSALFFDRTPGEEQVAYLQKTVDDLLPGISVTTNA